MSGTIVMRTPLTHSVPIGSTIAVTRSKNTLSLASTRIPEASPTTSAASARVVGDVRMPE